MNMFKNQVDKKRRFRMVFQKRQQIFQRRNQGNR
jgi:hypothetical protein